MITVRIRHLPFRMRFDPQNSVCDVVRDRFEEGEQITTYYAGGLVVNTYLFRDGSTQVEFNRPVEIDFSSGEVRLIDPDEAEMDY